MHPQTKIAISGIQNRMRDTSVEMNDQPALKRMFYDLARAILESELEFIPGRDGSYACSVARGFSMITDRIDALEQNTQAAVAVPLHPVRWEYLFVDEDDIKKPANMNDAGDQGWELCQVTGICPHRSYIFKRPRAPE